MALGERLQRSEPRHRHSPRRPPAPRHPPPRSRRAQVTGPAAPGGRTAALPPPPGACGGPSGAAGRLHGALPNPAPGPRRQGGSARRQREQPVPRGAAAGGGGGRAGEAAAAPPRRRGGGEGGEAPAGAAGEGPARGAAGGGDPVGATLWARERGWGRRLRRAGRKRGARAGAAGCGLPPGVLPGRGRAAAAVRPSVGRARFPALRPFPDPAEGSRRWRLPLGQRGAPPPPPPLPPCPPGLRPRASPRSVRLPGRGRGILRRHPRRWAEVSGINAR